MAALLLCECVKMILAIEGGFPAETPHDFVDLPCFTLSLYFPRTVGLFHLFFFLSCYQVGARVHT